MARCTFSSDYIVIKSPNDRRLYRLIKLENGLSALLVHDPEIYLDRQPEQFESTDHGRAEEEEDDNDDEDSEGEDEEYGDGDVKKKRNGNSSQSKKAAAAMSVGIGSFSDPPEAQGLAHFPEHMLFMGSTEFPDENDVFCRFSVLFRLTM